MATAVRKWDMKTWAIIGLGGAVVVMGAAFLMQSNHTALGRQVHRNVTKFLVDHGSQVHSGVISGGLVSTPMKTNIAVNSTVVSMLNSFADQMGQNPGGSPDMQQEQQVVTGMGGNQGRGAQGGGLGSSLRPSSGSPQPAGSSPRGAKPPASVIRNPTEVASDDGGYAQQTGRTGNVQGSEYNPDEFAPRGAKPAGDTDLFAGDGIPSSGSGAPMQAPVAGYE